MHSQVCKRLLLKALCLSLSKTAAFALVLLCRLEHFLTNQSSLLSVWPIRCKRKIFPRLAPITCFPGLRAGYCFPALDTGYKFSRVCHQLHVLPRYPPVTEFLVLLSVPCFPILDCIYTFSRALHLLRFFSYQVLSGLS